MKKKILLTFVSSILFLSSLAYAQFGRLGHVDSISHDNGIIVIDGNEFNFVRDQIEIIYREEPVRFVFLRSGLTVRYEARNGVISRVTLMGPENELQEILNR